MMGKKDRKIQSLERAERRLRDRLYSAERELEAIKGPEIDAAIKKEPFKVVGSIVFRNVGPLGGSDTLSRVEWVLMEAIKVGHRLEWQSVGRFASKKEAQEAMTILKGARA